MSDSTQPTAPATPTATKTVPVRILVDHQEGDEKFKCNTVVSLDPKRAAYFVKSGLADDNADAVQAGYKAMAEAEAALGK